MTCLVKRTKRGVGGVIVVVDKIESRREMRVEKVDIVETKNAWISDSQYEISIACKNTDMK